jgi:hypothetical protein
MLRRLVITLEIPNLSLQPLCFFESLQDKITNDLLFVKETQEVEFSAITGKGSRRGPHEGKIDHRFWI